LHRRIHDETCRMITLKSRRVPCKNGVIMLFSKLVEPT
jgi:hypothetical protein